MSVNPALMFPPATEGPVACGTLPVQQIQFLPGSGDDSTKERGGLQNAFGPLSSSGYEAEMQLNSPGEIGEYLLFKQHGSFMLKVPSRRWLRLVRQIPQELVHTAAPCEKAPAGLAGGNHDGR